MARVCPASESSDRNTPYSFLAEPLSQGWHTTTPRLRALATLNRGPWPSLRTWACPDPTPPDRAIEFWQALLMFLQDPAAPPVSDRLRDSHKIQAAPT
ncbi:hypothetical protein HPB50_008723 [Hyalomma asiaticum]|uniref:Uncharacterized protein n=1 Tax=Hyalomma asiaticum TaxID=266040 RepID=A0ACB7THI8_HYAAI|nr:hypothetical protein HPB50_008723 [Hyalomma asiaticum]